MHVMSRHKLFLAVMMHNTLFSLTPEAFFLDEILLGIRIPLERKMYGILIYFFVLYQYITFL